MPQEDNFLLFYNNCEITLCIIEKVFLIVQLSNHEFKLAFNYLLLQLINLIEKLENSDSNLLNEYATRRIFPTINQYLKLPQNLSTIVEVICNLAGPALKMNFSSSSHELYIKPLPKINGYRRKIVIEQIPEDNSLAATIYTTAISTLLVYLKNEIVAESSKSAQFSRATRRINHFVKDDVGTKNIVLDERLIELLMKGIVICEIKTVDIEMLNEVKVLLLKKISGDHAITMINPKKLEPMYSHIKLK